MVDSIDELKEKKQQWQEKVLKPALDRFFLKDSPNRFYSPLDIPNFDFGKDVGFPGDYPFTAGTYPVVPYMPAVRGGAASGSGLVRAAMYSGYGTPEDTRDYYAQLQAHGQRGGPNLAFDLPTQCGYDSDNPLIRGDVGKTGVAVDTLRDFEIIYEPFQGEFNLDRIASNFTINAPANIILAMYFALAEKRGIPLERLRGTPQNDILKEFIARGTYIFPPGPSMRMVRDSIVFLTKYCPHMNINQLGGYHIRGAGATREQDLAFSMAILVEYLKEGVKAGLDIDSFAPSFTVNAFGGSMEFFKEIAFQRAARRMWAKILKEKFGAKKQKSMLLRQAGLNANMGNENCTTQRPLNNLTRAVVGAIASALSGGMPVVYPPYDEPIGLGWSREASQLSLDGMRILQYEAKLTEVLDPLAGSYYIESLTNEIEDAAWHELENIEKQGGAVEAVANGYMQSAIARSAYERQKRIESGEDLVVGVNCFTGQDELEILTTRLVPHPYDPAKRESAEERQIQNLKEVKNGRDNRTVASLLNTLKVKAGDPDDNLMPHFIECAGAYVTLQEMCDVLRDVFGEYQPAGL